MRAGGRGLTGGREKFSARRFLVVAQVALSLVLLVGALLFVTSLQKLLRVDPGFRAEGLISVDLNMQRLQIALQARAAALREYQNRLSAIPGVTSAAQIGFTAVSGSGWNENVWAEGGDGKRQNSYFNRAGAGYFKTMGTSLVAGREFDDRDSLNAPKVAIVNEAFVKRFFGEGNPVGRTFRVEGNAGQADPIYQVVGVVRNTKYYELREDFLPIAFLPMSQEETPGVGGTWVLRTQIPAGDVFRAVKSTMAAVHPEIQLYFRIMSQQLEESLLRDRLMATLAGAFGLLAGLLSTLGLYGVISYMVARRRNEIGIRVALGAGRGSVIRLVLREAAVLLAIGLAIGIGFTLWASKAATTLLFGLKPNEPVILAGASALLAAVALLASFLPAQRASRLEPMRALRED
jgi:predicted permease